MNKIADNTVLILSGVPCVGKTSVAYKIIQKYSIFRRVSEMDIVRAVIRTVFNDLINESLLSQDIVDKYYSELFTSLTVSDLNTTKLQSQKLIPYIKEIILRQQRRKIPTIIEGSGIIPSLFFPEEKPLEWLNSNIVFVNLYISDAKEQKRRRNNRYFERGYASDYNEIIEREDLVMSDKNQSLHTETLSLSNIFPNVFSIDTALLTTDQISMKIMDMVVSYFSNKL